RTAAALPMGGMDPLPVVAAELDGGHYRGRGLLPLGGRWRLHVSVRRGATVAAADVTVTLAAASLRAPAAARPTGARTPAPGIWQHLGPGVITYALVVDPGNHARLYEGTVAGAFRSGAGGAHWTKASPGLSGWAR